MSGKILACPYCGGEVVNSEWNIGSVGWLECDNCGATGPRANNIQDAILLWNAAANALAKKNAEIEKLKQWLKNCIDEEKKRADDATEIQHKLNAEIARLTAALADTEEQRHEAVSKLSLALIREVESNKRQDELKAEIEQLRKERHTMCIDYERVEQERDEARRVARVWYNWYNTEYKAVKLINDTFRTAMRDGVVIEVKLGDTDYPYPIPKRMRYYANESGQWLEPVYI